MNWTRLSWKYWVNFPSHCPISGEDSMSIPSSDGCGLTYLISTDTLLISRPEDNQLQYSHQEFSFFFFSNNL